MYFIFYSITRIPGIVKLNFYRVSYSKGRITYYIL